MSEAVRAAARAPSGASVHKGLNSPRPYYLKESVGIAVGFLLAALHRAGLATLTHMPSPMRFLNQILDRQAEERAASSSSRSDTPPWTPPSQPSTQAARRGSGLALSCLWRSMRHSELLMPANTLDRD